MNFKEFYLSTGKSIPECASETKFSESFVIKLIRAERCPGPKTMVVLKAWSDGLITSDDCQKAYLMRLADEA